MLDGPERPVPATDVRQAFAHRGRRIVARGCDGGPVQAGSTAAAARRCGRCSAARRRSLSALTASQDRLPGHGFSDIASECRSAMHGSCTERCNSSCLEPAISRPTPRTAPASRSASAPAV